MQDAAKQKLVQMTQAPIRPLILKMAIPTIMTMLITSIYNMADTFFIGRLQNNSATGAVGVAVSLMSLIQGVGFTIGMGSGTYISRLLGKGERETAETVASTGFFTSLILGLLVTVLGTVFLDPLVRSLGATPTILPYAREYVRYILMGAPFMCASFVMNNILRMQGSAFYSMIGMCSGGLINIALDPLFIFTFNMGIGGAALATIISQFISFCLLLFNCSRGGNLRPQWRRFSPRWPLYRTILAGGLPSFYRQGLNSVSVICMNLSAGVYGDAAIAAMSVIGRIFMFATSALLGFGQGFQPVCGFNYGAKKYQRVLDAFWFCVKIAVVMLIFFACIGFLFAPRLIAVFRDDPQVVEIGSLAMRIQCLTFTLSSWIILCNMLLQTIGMNLRASVLALARQGLFFIPTVLVAPRLLGLLGLQMSQSISDVFSFILSFFITMSVLRDLKASAREQAKEADEADVYTAAPAQDPSQELS